MGNVKKAVSFLTAAVVAVGGVSFGAAVEAEAVEVRYVQSKTQDQSYMFSKNYKLTGNYADDVVAVAKAQIGRTQSEFQYYEDWCADFANDCARLTGMPDTIIPYNYGLRASCAYMYRYMIESCNAKVIEDVRDVRTGDYVFYYCPSSNFYLHVGIVESPDSYIEGNYDKMVKEFPFDYNFKCYMHGGGANDSNSGHVKRIYVRPDYPEPPVNGYTYTDPDKYQDSFPVRTLSYKEDVASSGFDVSWTQAVLYKLGYLKAVTGEYNKDTAAAVKKFQSDNKLNATGEVDANTANALKKAFEDSKTPYYTDFKCSKSVYEYGEAVRISAVIKNSDKSRIVIKDSSGKVVKTFDNTSSCDFPASDIEAGSYKVYLSLSNSYKSVDSQAVEFSVENPIPTAPAVTVKSGTTYAAAVLEWNKTEYTVSYDLYIRDSKGSNYIVKNNLTDCNFSVLLPEGSYSAFVVSKNNYFRTVGGTAYFTVKKGSPVDLGTGFYAKLNLSGNNLALGGDNNSMLKSANGGLSQSWYFIRTKDNLYTIKNCGSGKVLTYNSNRKVYTANDSDSSEQKWYIAKGNESYFLIPSNNTEYVVYAHNDKLYIDKSSDGAAEAFKLTKINAVHNYEITEVKAPSCTQDGYVHYHCIVCGKDSEKILSAEGHKYTEQKTDNGHSVFTCTNCGESREEGKTNLHNDEKKYEPMETGDTPDVPKNSSAAKKINTYQAVIGDVDGDGAVTVRDVLMINRASVGLEKLTDLGKVIADVDGDGKVTSADSLAVLRTVVNLYTESKTGSVIMIQSEQEEVRFMK